MKILAHTQKFLPPRFKEFCFPKKGTFNGVRFLEIYVDLNFFRELQDKESPNGNLWNWFFKGLGVTDVIDIDLSTYEMDWTFRGKEKFSKIPSYTHPIFFLMGRYGKGIIYHSHGRKTITE